MNTMGELRWKLALQLGWMLIWTQLILLTGKNRFFAVPKWPLRCLDTFKPVNAADTRQMCSKVGSRAIQVLTPLSQRGERTSVGSDRYKSCWRQLIVFASVRETGSSSWLNEKNVKWKAWHSPSFCCLCSSLNDRWLEVMMHASNPSNECR